MRHAIAAIDDRQVDADIRFADPRFTLFGSRHQLLNGEFGKPD